MKKNVLLIIIFLFFLNHVHAQTTDFSQSLTEMYLENPAGFGTQEGIEVGAINKSRFLGELGTDRTTSVTFNAPYVRNKHRDSHNQMGFGAQITNTNFHINNSNQISLYYAYHIPLQFNKGEQFFDYITPPSFSDFSLSFGISASLQYQTRNLQQLYYDRINGIDPVLNADASSILSPNFGFGVQLNNPLFTLGISIPYIFQNGTYQSNLLRIHLLAKVKIKVREDLNLYPIVRYVTNPNETNQLNFGIQAFWLEKFGADFLVLLNSDLKLGFHYKHHNGRYRINYYLTVLSVNREIITTGLPSHEISVFFNLKKN